MGGSGQSGGGGTSFVTSSPSAPVLLPEGKEGYVQASDFYKGILAQPPIFPDKRFAELTPTQLAAIEQGKTAFGQPSVQQGQAGEQVSRTLAGDYMTGPGAQAALASMAAPLFQRFEQETLPGIRGRALMAGHQPGTGTAGLTEGRAIERFGGELGRSVIAPFYEGERARQIGALQEVPRLTAGEISRLGALSQAGGTEQANEAARIASQREQFEEPIFRKAGAADVLGSLAGVTGGGGSSVTRNVFDQGGGGDNTMQWIQTAAMVAGTAAKLMCWVAATLYGRDTPRFLLARYWIVSRWRGPVATTVRWLYSRIGERVSHHPRLCRVFKPFFDWAVWRAKEDLRG